MDKYNVKELTAAIKVALSNGIKSSGNMIVLCSYLIMNRTQINM